ncbi:MAG: hypothetical protein NVS2B14_13410 [Chamaesiphon sp.]
MGITTLQSPNTKNIESSNHNRNSQRLSLKKRIGLGWESVMQVWRLIELIDDEADTQA